jgi:autotransporter strand-loop-strand O-heptosyltransferase
LANKTVFIVLDSKSLGDTIAWAGYALEFQKKHNCHVVMSTFWNKILDYPELELVEPGASVNCYALYRIGWKWDENKEPVLCNTIPLQQAASNILGLEFKEIKPKLKFEVYHRFGKKNVVIATNSTMGCKFWTKEGWQKVINYLCQNGYDVINVSKEDNPFDNCTKIHDTSIEYTMQVINNADLFIGLSSGLSWLAWALNQKVVMISNFTEADHEFDCYRVTKPDVCNGCWNDPKIKLDPYWDWCPRNKDFECQRSIPASMVIDKIKEAGF